MTQEERDIFRMNAYGWACHCNSVLGHTDKLANVIYESVAASTHKNVMMQLHIDLLIGKRNQHWQNTLL